MTSLRLCSRAPRTTIRSWGTVEVYASRSLWYRRSIAETLDSGRVDSDPDRAVWTDGDARWHSMNLLDPLDHFPDQTDLCEPPPVTTEWLPIRRLRRRSRVSEQFFAYRVVLSCRKASDRDNLPSRGKGGPRECHGRRQTPGERRWHPEGSRCSDRFESASHARQAGPSGCCSRSARSSEPSRG